MRPVAAVEAERARLEAEEREAAVAQTAAAARAERLRELEGEENAARLAEAEARRDLLADHKRLTVAHRVKVERVVGRLRDLAPDLADLTVLGGAANETRRQLAELGVHLPPPTPFLVGLGQTTAVDLETLRGLAQTFGAFADDPRGRVWTQAS